MTLDFGFPCKRILGNEVVCDGILYLYDKDTNHPIKKSNVDKMCCSWCGFERKVIKNDRDSSNIQI